MLIRIARAEAIATRHSTIMICVLRTEEDLGFYDNAIGSLEADKESVVTFGPWKAVPSVKDLLDGEVQLSRITLRHKHNTGKSTTQMKRMKKVIKHKS